jgi:SAM-dependent methyltransferase
MYAAIHDLVHSKVVPEKPRILSVGCYDDTAWIALKQQGWDILGIDPVYNTNLEDYWQKHDESFDIVFSTSVIEHVPDDFAFMAQCNDLIKPNGIGLLTCDYKEFPTPGDCIPGANERFYSVNRLHALHDWIAPATLLDEPDWTGHPADFHHAGHSYSFATMGWRKV